METDILSIETTDNTLAISLYKLNIDIVRMHDG